MNRSEEMQKKLCVITSGMAIKWFFLLISMLFSQYVIAQSCNTNMIPTAPTQDFTVHGDGTVTHKATDLMWKVCSEGQTWSAGACSGTITTHSWDQALQIPQTLNAGAGYAGETDWRLPNIKELKSILELSCSTPAINETIFPSSEQAFYWSSSPSASNISHSWGADLTIGDSRGQLRSGEYSVRLVRGGP